MDMASCVEMDFIGVLIETELEEIYLGKQVQYWFWNFISLVRHQWSIST